MRINWSDEPDYAGQFELWQANCERSLRGKRGMAALRDLEAALLALPSKRLIADDVVTADGEVCAVGALLAARAVTEGASRDEAIAELLQLQNGETWWERRETDHIAAEKGVPRLVAWKLVEMNDIELDRATPEQRYEAVLAWVQERLAAVAA